MFGYFVKCLQLIMRDDKSVFIEMLELPETKFFKTRLLIYRFLPTLALIILLTFNDNFLVPYGITNPYLTIIVALGIDVNVILIVTLILMRDIKIEKTIKSMFALGE